MRRVLWLSVPFYNTFKQTKAHNFFVACQRSQSLYTAELEFVLTPGSMPSTTILFNLSGELKTQVGTTYTQRKT